MQSVKRVFSFLKGHTSLISLSRFHLERDFSRKKEFPSASKYSNKLKSFPPFTHNVPPSLLSLPLMTLHKPLNFYYHHCYYYYYYYYYEYYYKSKHSE
jgi:hypothetical protein